MHILMQSRVAKLGAFRKTTDGKRPLLEGIQLSMYCSTRRVRRHDPITCPRVRVAAACSMETRTGNVRTAVRTHRPVGPSRVHNVVRWVDAERAKKRVALSAHALSHRIVEGHSLHAEMRHGYKLDGSMLFLALEGGSHMCMMQAEGNR